jgi:hypothetical protein
MFTNNLLNRQACFTSYLGDGLEHNLYIVIFGSAECAFKIPTSAYLNDPCMEYVDMFHVTIHHYLVLNCGEAMHA